MPRKREKLTPKALEQAGTLSQNRKLAKCILNPVSMSAVAIGLILEQASLSLDQQSIQGELSDALAKFKTGDSAALEELLASQLLTLQVLTNNLLGQGSLASDVGEKETLISLGLKSGNLLRQTALSLHELHNPKKSILLGNN